MHEGGFEQFTYCTRAAARRDHQHFDLIQVLVRFEGRSVDITHATGAYHLRMLAWQLCQHPDQNVELQTAGMEEDTALVTRQAAAVRDALLGFGVCKEQVSTKISSELHSLGVGITVSSRTTRSCTRQGRGAVPELPDPPPPRSPHVTDGSFVCRQPGDGTVVPSTNPVSERWQDLVKDPPSVEDTRRQFASLASTLCDYPLFNLVLTATAAPADLSAASQRAETIVKALGVMGIPDDRITVRLRPAGSGATWWSAKLRLKAPTPRGSSK